ncbi:MAG: hypothetical protein OXF79_05635 [Chloroflexi bacterium]|nr:hypothetical protein [Chloroflexota bacterium]
MLTLLDHSVPQPLRAYLPAHTVHTAEQLGWDRLPDGEVITLAEEAGYELPITCDKGIRYQQNLVGRNLSVLVLMYNNWRLIRARVDAITASINEMGAGELREVTII